MTTRREFLATAAAPLAASAQAAPPKRIAAIVTEYRPNSHADVIVGKYLEGYRQNGQPPGPRSKIVSMYTAQVPNNDMSREMAGKYHVPIYPTIWESLTLGGAGLAVDGVLLIGEHGQYPWNEKGQHLYPRFEFFEQIVKVFESSGRSVPVFNDKHLSWNWEWARQMYDTSRRLNFPFMAGSSLPVTWRTPSLEMPHGASVREAVCVGYGGLDSYDFHALETLQCMVERRKGGESGVRWVRAYRGEDFWKAHQEGIWSKDLLESALCRSHTLKPARPGFNDIFPTR